DDADAAEPLVGEALRVFMARLPADHRLIARGHAALGHCYLLRGGLDAAERELLSAYHMFAEADPPGRAELADVACRLVELYERWGAPAAADEYRAACAESE
ncbi:MAG: hypothetical protein JXO22_16805, partial [Phycisphaerae bacterium]|nr:hypothetical protein [Phycisphaerae bacterium]